MSFGAAGQTAMAPGQAQNLAGALRAQSAPANGKTPDQRVDPSEKRILDLQRIRRALEIAMDPDHMPDGDPLRSLLAMMHGTITRLRDGVDPAVVVLSLAQNAAQTAQQMSPQPTAGAAVQPGPATTAGPPQGAQPAPAPAPVSPGPPPGQ